MLLKVHVLANLNILFEIMVDIRGSAADVEIQKGPNPFFACRKANTISTSIRLYTIIIGVPGSTDVPVNI